MTFGSATFTPFSDLRCWSVVYSAGAHWHLIPLLPGSFNSESENRPSVEPASISPEGSMQDPDGLSWRLVARSQNLVEMAVF